MKKKDWGPQQTWKEKLYDIKAKKESQKQKEIMGQKKIQAMQKEAKAAAETKRGKKLSKGIHVGTNIDLKNGLKCHKPRYHIDTKTGVGKIAKKGVDLQKHLDRLPDDQTELTATKDMPLDHCVTGSSGLKTVIELEELAK